MSWRLDMGVIRCIWDYSCICIGRFLLGYLVVFILYWLFSSIYYVLFCILWVFMFRYEFVYKYFFIEILFD